MQEFEKLRQRVVEELARLREFFETEVKPATERSAVQALRAASERLSELAQDIETRASRRNR